MKAIKEYLELKEKIDALKARQDELVEELHKAATFPEGKKTGHIFDRQYKVTVSLRDNVTWDQKKLEEARGKIGNERFFNIFKAEFKPAYKADLYAAILVDPAIRKVIAPAMTVKPGKPSIKIEEVA
jgi:hypothetical protein